MFIKKVKNREGKVYYSIGQNYRQNGKIKYQKLKTIGRSDILALQHQDVDQYCQDMLAELHAKQCDTPDISTRVKNRARKGVQNANERKNAGYLILDSVYKRLNIPKKVKKYSKKRNYKYDLNKILKLLVFSRILDPRSKLAACGLQKELFGHWNLEYNDIMRGLKHIKRVKEDLQLSMHKAIKAWVGRNAELVFYDVTSYHFKGDSNGCGIRYAHSDCAKALDPRDKPKDDMPLTNRKDDMASTSPKDDMALTNPKDDMPLTNRKDDMASTSPKDDTKGQKNSGRDVNMGIFMDSNGIPISYQIFDPDIAYSSDYIKGVEQIKQQFGISKIVTVADKTFSSKSARADALKRGDGYLVSRKFKGVKGSKKVVQAFVMSSDNWEYSSDLSFAKKSMIRERKLENGETVQEKVLITWREKDALHKRNRRGETIECKNPLRDPKKFRIVARKGGKKYQKLVCENRKTGEILRASPYIGLNTELLEFDELFDGMNLMLSSEISMSDDDMIKAYRQLDRIEDCFKITKTKLNAGVVYLSSRTHIEAHFLSCFIALVLVKILQHRLNNEYSAGKIIEAIKSIKVTHCSGMYYSIEGNDNATAILERLGHDWSQEIKDIKEIKALGK
ncbi:MAG: transposase [Candidatus Ancillula sp.]|jgi:hypothetical protein|nr:transposase [Candidatus Ancillula sp.]